MISDAKIAIVGLCATLFLAGCFAQFPSLKADDGGPDTDTDSDIDTDTDSDTDTDMDSDTDTDSDTDADTDADTDTDTYTGIEWWDAAWPHRLILVLDNSSQSEDLLGFPVLVKLTIERIDYGDVGQADGADLRFIDDDDTTELAYEIDQWDASGDSYVWVRVPQVDGSSSSDFISMYYGNADATDGQDPDAVWADGYMNVLHFAETSGDYLESTVYGNHGTVVDVASRTADGKIGYCPEFDPAFTHTVDCGASYTAGDMTISAWVFLDTAASYRPIIQHGANGETEPMNIAYGLEIDGSSELWQQWEYGNGSNEQLGSSAVVPLTTWTLVSAIRDSTAQTVTWYIDGVQAGAATDFTNDPTGGDDAACALHVGRRISSGQQFDGRIDELRISGVVRSSDWIAAQHASMNDTFVFW